MNQVPDRVGRYRVLRRLATGGMGHVFLAELDGEPVTRSPVVVKTLLLSDDDEQRAMFLDEARIAAGMVHAHVARILDVGVDDGVYFLAMEYVHGETVRAVLDTARRRHQAIPLAFSLSVVVATAAGLHHAHQRCGPDGEPLGIVHRDISPSNVMVGYDGSVKVIDFGIAKAVGRMTSTRAGRVKGKAGYMAPEQLQGTTVDKRCDVFALGILLYELTTQTRAFGGGSDLETMRRIHEGDLARPTSIAPSIPLDVEALIMRSLARDPAARYQDAAQLRDALVAISERRRLMLGPHRVRRLLAHLFDRECVSPSESTATPSLRSVVAVGPEAGPAVPESLDDDGQGPTLRVPWTPPEVDGGAGVTRMGGVVPPRPSAGRSGGLAGLLAAGMVAVISTITVGALAARLAVKECPTSAREAVPAPSRLTRSSAAAAAAAAAAAPPPAIVSASTASIPRPQRQVHLRVTSLPSRATVLLDGVRIGKTPLDTFVPRRDGKTSTLKIRRHGASAKLRVDRGADIARHVQLPTPSRLHSSTNTTGVR